MYFRHATETDVSESIVFLNEEGDKTNFTRKVMVIYKKYISFYFMNYSTSVLNQAFIPILFSILKLRPFIRKSTLITYQITGQCLY